MRWTQSTALLLTAGALCGCTDDRFFADRYGPSPTLVAETVQASVARQAAVVAAVAGALDPRTGQFVLAALPDSGDRLGWYKVIMMGFNTIDDACTTYIDDLWILERRKTRNSTILHAAGAAAAALVTAAQTSPSTAAALVILAQSFGFAGILNNAIADSYLYSQSAANVRQLVKATTEAYRNDLAKNFTPTQGNGLPAEVAYPMASVPAEYFHMREYLSLCLPPAIQGQVDKLVAGAVAAPAGQKPAGGGGVTSLTGVTLTRAAPRTSPQLRTFGTTQ